MKTQALAFHFARFMAETLDASELASANATNEANAYSNSACGSHDYIDANDVMLRAMEFLGLKNDPADEQCADTINDAWRIAKCSHFNPEKVRADVLQQLVQRMTHPMADDGDADDAREFLELLAPKRAGSAA